MEIVNLNTASAIDIRNNLFSSDEDRTSVILGSNMYLQSADLYENARDKVKDVNPTFINGDLFKIDLKNKYDNIWLSNIGTYLSRHFVKIMTDKMSQLLQIDGRLLISYLYKTTIDTKYEEGWNLIYDLEKTFAILSQYDPTLISFIGVEGLKFDKPDVKDSVLVYRKR